MALIKQEDINNIRSSVDIVDIVGSYLPLTQRGRNYFGVCPFHDDHSPSMSVSKEKQIYTCFSCGATGNVFNFIMDYEHISFVEAVKLAADTAGYNLNININTTTKNNSVLYSLYDISSKFYQNNINTENGKYAKSYLKKRGIDDDVLKEFKIGLSNQNSLTELLKEKGYKNDELLASGLTINKDNELKDIFYNRIMFPLFDLTGKVVAYSGRIYNKDDNSKYINTKETEIFKKGELLYNYHIAKDYARKEQTIYIMEGFMDVIMSSIAGVKNVVATMGTAVTKEQAILMKRLAKNIVLCFDSDEAGKKAAYSCSNELIKMGVIPSVVVFDNDLDPDEFIKQFGKNKFIEKLHNPLSIMDYKAMYLKNNIDFKNSVDMSNYINKMLDEIGLINDDILKEITLKKLSEEVNLDIDFLKTKVKEEVVKPVIKEQKLYNKYDKAERNLLYYMLNKEEVIKIFNRDVSFLPSKKGRSLANKINDFYDKYDMISIADFISTIDEKEIKEYISEILALDLNDIYKIDEINDYINVINDYNYQIAIDRLNEKLKNTYSKEEKIKLGEEILKLKLRRNEND